MADREVTPGSGLHREPPAPLDGVTPEPIDGVAGAMRWFATERNTLETVVADPPVVGFATWQLVESMVPFYQRCGMFRAWEATAAASLHTARRRDDGAGLARMHRVVAGAKDFQGRNTSAISHCTRALGERYVRAGRLPEAIQAWRDARQTYIELGFDKGAASLTRRLAGAGAEPRP